MTVWARISPFFCSIVPYFDAMFRPLTCGHLQAVRIKNREENTWTYSARYLLLTIIVVM